MDLLKKRRIIRRKRRGIYNSIFWSKQLVSAVILGDKTKDIVLTFSGTVRPLLKAAKAEFSVTGTARTVGSIKIDEAAKTVTVSVTRAYTKTSTCTLHHTPAAPNKGDKISTVVINNIDN